MTGSRLMHWILCCLAAAIAFAGCTSDGTTSENTGGLNLNLELAEGVVINEVAWTISSPGMDDMSGTIDTSAPGATASVEVFGLPPGDDYLVELEATDESGDITCGGDAPFSVEIGEATDVMVFLNCKRPPRLGAVRVNGQFNICAELEKAIVSPLQTSVGYDIDLSAITHDAEEDDVTIVWSATGGSIDDPNADATTYTCGEVGDHSITITVSDDDFEFCIDDWTVAVTCVEGDENLCEGVTCEDDGNDCTVAECNLATGECETDNLDDGTECNDGAGACMDGECVDVDLCEGVECDDQNECTTDFCNPFDGICDSDNVEDGTECDGGNGMCVDGTCMMVDLCEGVTCDDTGNDCTTAACNNQTGECETMNVPDGTECNGGAGACSAGECVDNNLCEGVDCTSDNDCVQDGTCDPGTGECIAGGNEPADTPCDGDTGVCDGAGTCVDCNSGDQCPDDGNECTTATCDSSTCGQTNVMDGTACDFNGADGVCEAGQCVEAPECISPGDCDDDNVCTAESCDGGTCVYEPLSGGSCDAGGLPGTCDAGSCVGLCEGVDCTSQSQCVQDGTCDDQTGECTAGDNEPVDTACTEGGGSVCDGAGNCVECNNDGQCAAGETCTDNACVPGAVDPDPQSKDITVGCVNNATTDTSILSFRLDADPGPLAAGQPVSILFDGEAAFTKAFLDAGLGLFPGLTRASLTDLQATIEARAGLTPEISIALRADPSALTVECSIFPAPCEVDSDCAGFAFGEICGAFVDLPLETDCSPGGACEQIDPANGPVQCAANGYCIAGDLPLPLDAQSADFTVNQDATEVLLGWWDDGQAGFPLAGDGTYDLPGGAPQISPLPEIGVQVVAGPAAVALECIMAVDSGGPDGVGVPDQASPTPDANLISFGL